MAKTKGVGLTVHKHISKKKVTSIGDSSFTRYNSKNDKKMGKKLYRGQGK